MVRINVLSLYTEENIYALEYIRSKLSKGKWLNNIWKAIELQGRGWDATVGKK